MTSFFKKKIEKIKKLKKVLYKSFFTHCEPVLLPIFFFIDLSAIWFM